MAGGQIMDLEAEKASFDLPTVTRLQAMKTGALIACSVECGAILGRVPPEGRTGLRGYAHDLGLAFQIADDILDAEGDEELAGKRLRKDCGRGKETFLTLLGSTARAPRPGCSSARRSSTSTSSAARPICCATSPASCSSATGEARPQDDGETRMTIRTGVYPGTFDPMTLGHIGHHPRGAKLVDRLVIGVTTNPSKSPMFSVEERVATVRRETAGIAGDIRVVTFDSLLMDFAEREGASMIVRGLRAVADFEYEYQMAGMNQQLNDRIETVFLMADGLAPADRQPAGEGDRAVRRVDPQVRDPRGRGGDGRARAKIGRKGS